jgi:hypothetical protein
MAAAQTMIARRTLGMTFPAKNHDTAETLPNNPFACHKIVALWFDAPRARWT